MKCGALIRRELRGKKNPKLKVVELISRALLERGFTPRAPLDQYETCDGTIRFVIGFGDDGGCYCCSNPTLEVSYVCDKCKNTNFPDLPYATSEIESIMTKAIAELP